MIATLLACVALSAVPYAEAREAAGKDHKPLVVFATAEWCGYCHKIQPEVEAACSDVHLAIVDIDQEPKLAKKFAVGGTVPQLTVYRIEKERWVSRRYVGVDQIREAINARK